MVSAGIVDFFVQGQRSRQEEIKHVITIPCDKCLSSLTWLIFETFGFQA